MEQLSVGAYQLSASSEHIVDVDLGPVSVREEVFREGRYVAEALQGAVHEARVA